MSKKDFMEAKEAKRKLAEAEEAEAKKAEEAEKAKAKKAEEAEKAKAKKAEEAEKAKAKKAEEAEKDDGIEEKIIAFLEIMEAGMKDFERRLSELEADKASKKDKKPEPAVAAPDRSTSTSTTYEKIHPPKGDAADFWDVLLPDGDYAVKKTKEAAEAEANASDPSGAPHCAIPFPWWVDAQGEPVERVKPEEAKAMRRMRI